MDEHEALIEYSEMTTFNFNSKEFQDVKRDYLQCKNAVTNFAWIVSNFISRFKPAKISKEY